MSMKQNLTLEELREAWEDTKANGGKYLMEAKYGGMFGMECKGVRLKWMPFKKVELWSWEVNTWRYETEDIYGRD